MCKGERPIGAANGKETNTMASCYPPPPHSGPSNPHQRWKIRNNRLGSASGARKNFFASVNQGTESYPPPQFLPIPPFCGDWYKGVLPPGLVYIQKSETGNSEMPSKSETNRNDN